VRRKRHVEWIFGSGEDLHVAAWQAVKAIDRSEETQEDGTIVQRERERFTNELTLVAQPVVPPKAF